MWRPHPPKHWCQLRWPNEVTPDQVAAALLSLNGSSTPRRVDSLLLIATGQRGQVTHYLAVPAARGAGVRHHLEAEVPGLAVEPLDQPPALTVNRAWRCWSNTTIRPLGTSRCDVVSRALITALASAEGDERLVLRWVLGPVRRPAAPIRTGYWRQDLEPVLGRAVVEVLGGPNRSADPEARAALAQKRGRPAWRATLHLGVHAKGRHRQRQLLGRLAAAARMAQASGVQLGFRPVGHATLSTGRLPVRRNLYINVAELEGLAGWPIGRTDGLPVANEPSRLLAPAATMPRGGRLVAVGTYPGAERPLTLSATDALQHLHVIGPTGTGKTTLLLNLICQDMQAGRSVVVIEPRGDLVNDVLARVPEHRMDDVVVVDPVDPAPVGVNPLATPGVSGDLKAEHLLTIFKSLYAESWGPRTQDLLTAGLLTLAEIPDMSLAALPLLFIDERFRRRIVARIDDPLALDQFWAWFEDLTPGERADVLAPLQNKLRAFLLRKPLRRLIGQANPHFDLRDVYHARPVLLVNLATGALGPEASALLGAAVAPIPSLTSAQAFDSGVRLGPAAARRLVDHVRQCYAGARPIETPMDLESLGVIHDVGSVDAHGSESLT